MSITNFIVIIVIQRLKNSLNLLFPGLVHFSSTTMLSRECYKWLWVFESSEEHCTDSEAAASHKSRTSCTYFVCCPLHIARDAIGKAARELGPAIFQLRLLLNVNFPHHPLKSSSSWSFIPATQAHLNCLYRKPTIISPGVLPFCLLWSIVLHQTCSCKFLLCSSWDLVDQVSISIFDDRLRILWW